ncbi:IQ domain-containing protein N [Microcebus murinus]|uniref:IQ domain-containing protein N n=1 Tax=Microcebus murinus TaxID=30608 RepID=UPI003F6C2F8F
MATRVAGRGQVDDGAAPARRGPTRVPPPPPPQAELPRSGPGRMQRAARPPPPPHQLPPGGQCFPQLAPGPRSHGVGGSPQPPRGAHLARDRLAQQLAEAKTGPRPVPRLRVVVESQAFKNILVDEMDMMLARAATLIQANWRRYRLRQKLISQVTAARAIQEAWRRFSMRRLLRSSRSTVKRVAAEEGDIPYHAPQQVRFQPQGESQPPPSPRRRMLSKETQFPSCDSLAPSSPWLAPCPPPPPPAEPVCPAAPHTFLPPPTAAIGFPCPVGLDPPCQPGQPCLLTETVRSTCLVHVESNVVKAKPGAAGASRAGSPEPPPQPPLPGRYGQAVARPLKIQTQVQVETETFKSPLQMCPEPAATKTPPKASPVPPAPTVTTAKALPQAPVTKAPAHMCPGPGAATKTPIPARPAASVGSVRPQPRPVAAVARIPPQVCLLASMFKPLPQARHMALMGKTPPPPASPVARIPPAQARPAPKSSSQTSPAASSSKTSSQACPVASATKPPAQMRLAAMLSKTPAQVATVLRTLCLSSPAAGTLKAPPQAGMAAGVAPVHPNTPKAKAPVANARQAPGAARAQPHPYLAGGKVRCFPQPHPGAPAGAAATAPKAGDRPPPEAERVRAGPQRQRDAEVAPKTGVPVGMTRMMSWTKVVEEGHKDSLQTHLRTEVIEVQSQVYVPVEMAGTLPQGPPVPSLTKALCQERPPSMPQGPPVPSLTKTLCHERPPSIPQGLPATSLTKAFCQERPPSMPQGPLVPLMTKTLCHERPPSMPQGPPVPSMTKTLCHERPPSMPQGPPVPSLTKTLCHERPPSMPQGPPVPSLTKTLCHERPPSIPQGLPATSLTKAFCQERPPSMPQGPLVTSMTKTLCHERPPSMPQGPPVPSMTKTLCHERPPSMPQGPPVPSLTKTLCHEHPPAELTLAQLGTCSAKASSQLHLPTKVTKAPSLAHLVTCLSRVHSQSHLAMGATKFQSQGHLPSGLTKAQSQAQLVTGAAKCLFTAHPAADLTCKAQSQPLLAGPKAAAQPCLHPGARAKLEDRLTLLQQPPPPASKTPQGPRPVSPESQGMLVPVLAAAGQPACNVESWGDGGPRMAPPPLAGHAAPCQEDMAASQLASLCAELAAVLGSQEDLRALLAKALSQGEVRAALNQALSREVLGATVAKALPQGLLGMVLVKALSWSELGVTLTRALSRGELRAELTKAMQGRLAEVLSKALTEEERAALSQALCQGELGAVLSQSLSQAALRTGAILPKAASKVVGSGVTPVAAVDCRGTLSAPWGPALGLPRSRCSKVRGSRVGAWGGFAGAAQEMGDGPVAWGAPCLPGVPVGASVPGIGVTSVHRCALSAGLDPMLSWEVGPGSDASSLYLTLRFRKQSLCLALGAGGLASDLGPPGGGEGPEVHGRRPLQPPLGLWQPLIANGVGPSTNRPSVPYGTAPSSHRPHMVGRVAPRPWAASTGAGGVARGRPAGGVSRGRAARVLQPYPACGGAACWCQSPRVHKGFPSLDAPSPGAGVRPARDSQKTLQSRTQHRLHKQARPESREVTPSALQAATAGGQASRTQGYHGPFYAAPGSGLAKVHAQRFVPGQLGKAAERCVSAPPRPQEPATCHPPSAVTEFAVSLPPGPDSSLARSLSRGTVICSLDDSKAQSPLERQPSLLGPSTEGGPWEGGLEGDLLLPLLPQETGVQLQRSGDIAETELVEHRLWTPDLPCQPAVALEKVPPGPHRPASGHLTLLSMHWVSDRKVATFSLGGSSVDLLKEMHRETFRPKPRRTLSLGTVAPPVCRQPHRAKRLAPSLSQPTLAARVDPNLGHFPGASKVSPEPAHPTMPSGVVLSLGRPSATNRAASGAPPGPAQPSPANGAPPGPAQPSSANGAPPGPGRPSTANGAAPGPGRPSAVTGAAPGPGQPSTANGVAPGPARSSMTHKKSPRPRRLSKAGGTSPNLSQSSKAKGAALGPAQPSAASGEAPELAKPSTAKEAAPEPAQPSPANEEGPGPAQPSTANGAASGPAQPATANGAAPEPAQPSPANEEGPGPAQPSTANGAASGPAQPATANGAAPGPAQPATANGAAPGPARPSTANGAAPGPAQPSTPNGVAPGPAQPATANGAAPGPAQPSPANGAAPGPAQPYLAKALSSNLAQTSMTIKRSSGLGQPTPANGAAPAPAQPSPASGAAPELAQPSQVLWVTPGIVPPPSANGASPSLAHVSTANEVAPSIAQPTQTPGMSPVLARASQTTGLPPCLPHQLGPSGVSPTLGYPYMACGVSPSLAESSMASLFQTPVACREALSLVQPPTATMLTSSLPQPSVMSLSEPGWGPRPGSQVPCPRLDAVAPSLYHPSIVISVSPGRPYPCVAGGMDHGFNQPPPGAGVDPCEEPLRVGRVVSSFQDSDFDPAPTGFRRPPRGGGRRLGVCPSTVVTISTPNLCQVPAADKEACGLGRGHSPSKRTPFRGLAAGSPPGPTPTLFSMSQGPAGPRGCPSRRNAATITGPSLHQAAGGPAPTASQVWDAGGPLMHRRASTSPGGSPSLSRASTPHRPGRDLSRFYLGNVDPSVSQMEAALPEPLDYGRPSVGLFGPSTCQQAETGRAGGGLVPGSPARRMTPCMAPCMAPGVTPGMAPGVTPGMAPRVTPCMAPGVTPGMAPGVTPCMAPGVTPGMAPGVTPCMAPGVIPCVAPGAVPGVVAASLPPGAVMWGVGQSPPCGTDRKKRGRSASPVATPATPGSPQGCLTPAVFTPASPRPYHGVAVERCIAPVHVAHATNLAQVHPQPLRARSLHREPPLLSGPLQLSRDYGWQSPGAAEDWAPARPGEFEEVLSLESASSAESDDLASKAAVLKATPWMDHGLLGDSVGHHRRSSFEQETFPQGPGPLFGGEAPGHAKGSAPVLFQLRHSMVSSSTLTLQPAPAPGGGFPSTPLVAAGGTPNVQRRSLGGRATEPPSVHQQSVAHVGPQGHYQGTVASAVAPRSPQLARGSPTALGLQPGSASRMGSPPWEPQSPQPPRVNSLVVPYLATARKEACGHLQTNAVPSAVQKPAPGDHPAQSSCRASVGHKKPFRSMYGSIIPEILEGSLARTVPSHELQKQAPQAWSCGPGHAEGVPLASPAPIIHCSGGVPSATVPRLGTGVRRVSLGYESSPSGSLKPLFSQDMPLGPQAFMSPAASHKAPLNPAVLQGPVDAGVAGGRRWSSAVPRVAVKPTGFAVAPRAAWEPARDRAPWEPARRPSAVDPRLSPELMVSMQTVEAILIRAVTTIQAGARGYLVRRAVRVWHVMATVIQAHWRGYRVRRNLARLYRATTLIQAAWRGYCTRRDSARRQRMLLPVVWAELRRRSAAASDRPGSQERGARAGSEHRCFQSCQPRACSLCQSLGSGVGGPPSVVMLVGSSPRTCHTCGHTQPTRVVQGVGRGAAGQGGTPPWSPVPRLASPSPRQLRRQNQAATSIQSAWRGFRIRRQVSEQQKAAKMVQANWRGHYTRNCLTTDALLGRTSPWASSQHWQTFWPGV